MTDVFKIAVMTLAWTFIVGVMYMSVNVLVFGFVDPIMNQTVENASFETPEMKARWNERTTVIKSAFNIACFILVLIPYAYLFVRLLLKKEKTSQPVYVPQGGGW